MQIVNTIITELENQYREVAEAAHLEITPAQTPGQSDKDIAFLRWDGTSEVQTKQGAINDPIVEIYYGHNINLYVQLTESREKRDIPIILSNMADAFKQGPLLAAVNKARVGAEVLYSARIGEAAPGDLTERDNVDLSRSFVISHNLISGLKLR